MNNKEYLTKGNHMIVDFYGINKDILDDLSYLEELLVESVKLSGANIEDITRKKFEPSGCTILMLLSESHASIHTYPEEGYMSCDIYTCGESIDPVTAIINLNSNLKPITFHSVNISRGLGRDSRILVEGDRSEIDIV